MVYIYSIHYTLSCGTCNIYVMQGVSFMALSATFNNISISLVEETGVSGENHQPAATH